MFEYDYCDSPPEGASCFHGACPVWRQKRRYVHFFSLYERAIPDESLYTAMDGRRCGIGYYILMRLNEYHSTVAFLFGRRNLDRRKNLRSPRLFG